MEGTGERDAGRGNGMREVDCGERDAGRRGDRTVGKEVQEVDWGKVMQGRGLWGMRCGERIVGTELWGKRCREEEETVGNGEGTVGNGECVCVCVYVCACMHVLCV